MSANPKLRATFGVAFDELEQHDLLTKADCAEARWVNEFTIVGPVIEVMRVIGILTTYGQPVLTGAYLL